MNAKDKVEDLKDALRTGRITLAAKVDGEEVVIPKLVFYGGWRYNRVQKERQFIVAIDDHYNEVGPRYYNPVIIPPVN